MTSGVAADSRTRIVVAGGSGYLGRPLVAALVGRGHDVVVLSRSVKNDRAIADASSGGRQRLVAWVPDGTAGPWATEIDGAHAVINLAGAGLADKRWSPSRKAELLSSRVLSTRSLVTAVRAAAARPPVFLQGSAVGFYGLADEGVFDESHPPGDDFLAEMAMAWEAEARPLEALGVRLVIVRTGIVLSRDGGALAKMMLPFQFFVGGPIARGTQYLSWIHLDDWIALILWALDTPAVAGAINASAPEPVTNRDFSAAIGRALHRPSWLTVPGFALRLLVGEMADVALIGGQRVLPKRTLALGFTFRYPSIDAAMRAAVERRRSA
jgi:uncharacterized protein (TIGR01777 family)